MGHSEITNNNNPSIYNQTYGRLPEVTNCSDVKMVSLIEVYLATTFLLKLIISVGGVLNMYVRNTPWDWIDLSYSNHLFLPIFERSFHLE